MHPTLMAALAAERHTELLRTAEQHRLARLARTSRPVRNGILSSAAASAGQRWQQWHSIPAPVQRAAPDPCCP
jgi:hypothetical protein